VVFKAIEHTLISLFMQLSSAQLLLGGNFGQGDLTSGSNNVAAQ